MSTSCRRHCRTGKPKVFVNSQVHGSKDERSMLRGGMFRRTSQVWGHSTFKVIVLGIATTISTPSCGGGTVLFSRTVRVSRWSE